MEEIRFSSVAELYQRLMPALKSKKRELYHIGCKYITENDIWIYLRNTKWEKRNNLTLYEMVDDILHTDNDLIDEFIRNEIKKNKEMILNDKGEYTR